MTVTRYINPDDYHPDAVAAATAGDVASLLPSQLILRLGVALRDNQLAEADAVVARAETLDVVGYGLFQLATARLILAHRRNDQTAFNKALTAWLDGRRQYPQNWRKEVLSEPEFATWLAAVDPKQLVAPVIPPHRLADEDRDYVQNLPEVRLAAVRENLEWLREMGLTEPEDVLAARYSVFSVNRDLREAMLTGRDGDPPIIVAFNLDGSFAGSFLAH